MNGELPTADQSVFERSIEMNITNNCHGLDCDSQQKINSIHYTAIGLFNSLTNLLLKRL